MDDNRFDRLAKATASGVSRRRLFLGLVGGVAGVGLHGQRDALALALPAAQVTYEGCERAGGTVEPEYSGCNTITNWYSNSRCSAFQYAWTNFCVLRGERYTIDGGCGPCLW